MNPNDRHVPRKDYQDIVLMLDVMSDLRKELRDFLRDIQYDIQKDRLTKEDIEEILYDVRDLVADIESERHSLENTVTSLTTMADLNRMTGASDHEEDEKEKEVFEYLERL